MSAPARDSHPTAESVPWQEYGPQAALLLALTVLFFWPQVVRGRVLYWGDIGLYFTPMLAFARENLRAGRLPLWNPLILCGTPYVGNPQTWLLYPLSALLPWLSAARFISLTVASHVWLAGLGTYLFARRALCVGRGPGLLAAVTFMFGGQLVSKEQFPNMVQAAAYLPWVLWRLDVLTARPRWSNALWLGVALGLQLLASHAQITLLTLYLGAAYSVWLGAGLPRARRRAAWTKLCGRLAVAGAVAFGLAAGQLLPTTELFEHAWRQRLSFHVVNRFYLPFSQTANFVLPTLHGHPYRGDFTARGNFWETCCYVGIVPFLAALWGASLAWRRGGWGAPRFWSGVFLVSLWMAWGGAGGLYRLAYWVLPGLRSFHDPARCLLWAAFALALLAAAGMEAVVGQNPSPGFARPKHRRPGGSPLPGGWGAAVVVGLAFLDLWHFGRTVYPLADAGRLHPVTPAVAAVQSDPDMRAGQARFLAPDSARTWQRFTGHQAYRQDAPDYVALWVDTLTPNLMMPYGLRDAFGYEPVARRDAQTVLGTATQGFRFEPKAKPFERAAAATWAGFLGVRYVVSFRTQPPSGVIPGLAPVGDDPTLPPLPGKAGAGTRVYLSRNLRWQPRARLATAFVSAPSARASQAVLTDALLHPAHVDLSKAVVVAGRVPFASAGAATPRPPVAIERDEPDRVALSFRTTRPALLVLADTGHPGWRAVLDGRPVAWLTADGCLRAVPVAASGAHRVVFIYAPTSFRLGLYVSLLTLSGLAAAAGFARARKITRRLAGFGAGIAEIGAR